VSTTPSQSQIRFVRGRDDEAAPLIGVEGLEPPKWASVDAQVAAASVWAHVPVRCLRRPVWWCGWPGPTSAA